MNRFPESDPWSHLYSAKRKAIACATVIEEMLSFLPDDVPYEVLDFGLHRNPGELKKILQDKIDESSKEAEILLLGYGLCSMAVVGLQSKSAYLVMPRTDDCIAIFLGSSGEYKKQMKKEPGTYYLTKGWIEAGDSPFEEHKKLVDKYGEEKAQYMTRLLFKNYKRLGFINTGQHELEHYRAYAREKAEEFALRFEEIEGSPALVKKLIHGPWDEDFLVVSPGQTIRYQDFINSSPK